MTHSVIHVEFIDTRTQQVFAVSDVPREQLPEAFVAATVMHFGDEKWQVIQAEPVTAAEFTQTGFLRLMLSKIESVSPKEVLYSLPTICDKLPSTLPNTPAQGKVFQIHEDNWWQTEFMTEQHKALIESEMIEIARIYQNHKVGMGFNKIYVRREIANPLGDSVRLKDVHMLVEANLKPFDSVSYARYTDVIPGAFAWDLGSFVLYGCADQKHVTRMGIDFAGRTAPVTEGLIDEVTGIMQAFDLLLVDWPRMRVVGGDTKVVQGFFG
ncbi:MAG: hypothetical protein U0670_13250 [Anaerolineae bacterium]